MLARQLLKQLPPPRGIFTRSKHTYRQYVRDILKRHAVVTFVNPALRVGSRVHELTYLLTLETNFYFGRHVQYSQKNGIIIDINPQLYVTSVIDLNKPNYICTIECDDDPEEDDPDDDSTFKVPLL